MHANLTLFPLGPGQRATAEKLVAQFAPRLAAREGYVTATFLADDTAGRYDVNWDAGRFSSGTYFYRLQTSGKVMVRKMLLLK